MRDFIRRMLAKYRRPYWRVVYELGFQRVTVRSPTHGGCPTTGLFRDRAGAESLAMYCDMNGRSPVPTVIERVDYNDPLVTLSTYRSKNAWASSTT